MHFFPEIRVYYLSFQTFLTCRYVSLVIISHTSKKVLVVLSYLLQIFAFWFSFLLSNTNLVMEGNEVLVYHRRLLNSGKESIAGVERTCQTKITCWWSNCQTANCKHSEMHADSIPCAFPDSVEKAQDVRGKPSTPETTSTETRKRTRKLEGWFFY